MTSAIGKFATNAVRKGADEARKKAPILGGVGAMTATVAANRDSSNDDAADTHSPDSLDPRVDDSAGFTESAWTPTERDAAHRAADAHFRAEDFVEFDPDVIQAMAAAMDQVADELQQVAAAKVKDIEATINAMKVDGRVPPVYKDTASALYAFADKLRENSRRIARRFHSDARFLRAILAAHEENERRAVNAIESVDAGLSV